MCEACSLANAHAWDRVLLGTEFELKLVFISSLNTDVMDPDSLKLDLDLYILLNPDQEPGLC